MNLKKLYKNYYKSQIGIIEILGTENEIVSLSFTKSMNNSINSNMIIDKCITQLDEYFKKKRKTFDLNLKLDGTKFQKKTWGQLLKIPYGKTKSYSDIAKMIKNDKAIRAVANACGSNHIAIIIPCHRVIGKNGKLTGYSSGIEKKKWLLSHESNFKTL